MTEIIMNDNYNCNALLLCVCVYTCFELSKVYDQKVFVHVYNLIFVEW